MTIDVNYVQWIAILMKEDRLFVNVMKDSFDSIPLWKIPNVLVRDEHLSNEWRLIVDIIWIGSPNEPEHVAIEELDQVSVRIAWKTTNDSLYHIECHHLIPCESYIIYQPNRTHINGSRYECHTSLSLNPMFNLVYKFLGWMRIPIIESKSLLNRFPRIYLVNPSISHSRLNDQVMQYVEIKKNLLF